MAGRKVAARTEEWWELIAGPTDVRCEAHVQSGDRCRRAAITGSVVCRQHGGAAKQVRERAAARIGNAADEMVKRLHAMLDDPAVPARDKIKVAQDMLDRAGLNMVEKQIIAVDSIETLFKGILNDPHGLVAVGDGTVSEAELEARRVAWAELNGEDALALESGTSRRDDVVEGEVVQERGSSRGPYDLPLIPEWGNEEAWEEEPTDFVSSLPPRHIREALERLI